VVSTRSTVPFHPARSSAMRAFSSGTTERCRSKSRVSELDGDAPTSTAHPAATPSLTASTAARLVEAVVIVSGSPKYKL
jgi:hypothetical protein